MEDVIRKKSRELALGAMAWWRFQVPMSLGSMPVCQNSLDMLVQRASWLGKSDRGVSERTRRDTYVETHGGLDHPTDVSIDDVDAFLNVGVLADIAAHHLNSGAGLLQVFDEFSGRCPVCAGSAQEHELASALFDHPFRHAAAQTAEASYHEIGLL